MRENQRVPVLRRPSRSAPSSRTYDPAILQCGVPFSEHRGLMKTRKLGNSDLQITPVGFGAWAIGGPGWAYSWGAQNDDDSIAAIHRALELGVNWIDTAAVYGLGHSEEIVGRAVKTSSHKPLVFTKCS